MNVLEPVPGGQPPCRVKRHEGLTREGCERLTQLREAELAAAVDFGRVLHEN
jgi:hypothetical protein